MFLLDGVPFELINPNNNRTVFTEIKNKLYYQNNYNNAILLRSESVVPLYTHIKTYELLTGRHPPIENFNRVKAEQNTK